MIKEITELFGDRIDKFNKGLLSDKDMFVLKRQIEYIVKNSCLSFRYRYTRVKMREGNFKATDYYYWAPHSGVEVNNFMNLNVVGLECRYWEDGTEVKEKNPMLSIITFDLDNDDCGIVEPISREEFLEVWKEWKFWQKPTDEFIADSDEMLNEYNTRYYINCVRDDFFNWMFNDDVEKYKEKEDYLREWFEDDFDEENEKLKNEQDISEDK